MVKDIKQLESKNLLTLEDKKILKIALHGIDGWNFNPIALIKEGNSDYYFICKVKTVIKNLQMKMAKVYVKIQEGNTPRLLAIEGI